MEDDLDDTVIEMTDEERAEDTRVKEAAELLAAQSRMTFDEDKWRLTAGGRGAQMLNMILVSFCLAHYHLNLRES